MNRDETENRLLDLLREKGPLTTAEIEREINRIKGSCPDGAVKTLMRLKSRGKVEGSMVPEKRGWVWKVRDVNYDND
jgi:hypothetical protein